MSRAEYRHAIEELRACQVRLSGKLCAKERAQVLERHGEALAVLEQFLQPRRSARTVACIARIADLEKKMEHYEPSDRATAIQTRLGLSKARYYELRVLALSPERQTRLATDLIQLRPIGFKNGDSDA